LIGRLFSEPESGKHLRAHAGLAVPGRHRDEQLLDVASLKRFEVFCQ
jgi:hypothetical protein